MLDVNFYKKLQLNTRNDYSLFVNGFEVNTDLAGASIQAIKCIKFIKWMV